MNDKQIAQALKEGVISTEQAQALGQLTHDTAERRTSASSLLLVLGLLCLCLGTIWVGAPYSKDLWFLRPLFATMTLATLALALICRKRKEPLVADFCRLLALVFLAFFCQSVLIQEEATLYDLIFAPQALSLAASGLLALVLWALSPSLVAPFAAPLLMSVAISTGLVTVLPPESFTLKPALYQLCKELLCCVLPLLWLLFSPKNSRGQNLACQGCVVVLVWLASSIGSSLSSLIWPQYLFRLSLTVMWVLLWVYGLGLLACVRQGWILASVANFAAFALVALSFCSDLGLPDYVVPVVMLALGLVLILTFLFQGRKSHKQKSSKAPVEEAPQGVLPLEAVADEQSEQPTEPLQPSQEKQEEKSES